MEKSGDTFGRRLSKSTSPHDPERWRRPALPGALSGRRSSRYLNKRSHSLHPLFRPTSVRSIAAKFPGTFCTMPKLSPWARQISGKRLVEKWNSTRILFSTHRISSDSPFSPCIDLQSPRTALLFDLDVTIEQVMGQAFCYPSPNAVPSSMLPMLNDCFIKIKNFFGRTLDACRTNCLHFGIRLAPSRGDDRWRKSFATPESGSSRVNEGFSIRGTRRIK
ncbi:unnamed protein product, partial [Nesidiocoris tenuis]